MADVAVLGKEEVHNAVLHLNNAKDGKPVGISEIVGYLRTLQNEGERPVGKVRVRRVLDLLVEEGVCESNRPGFFRSTQAQKPQPPKRSRSKSNKSQGASSAVDGGLPKKSSVDLPGASKGGQGAQSPNVTESDRSGSTSGSGAPAKSGRSKSSPKKRRVTKSKAGSIQSPKTKVARKRASSKVGSHRASLKKGGKQATSTSKSKTAASKKSIIPSKKGKSPKQGSGLSPPGSSSSPPDSSSGEKSAGGKKQSGGKKMPKSKSTPKSKPKSGPKSKSPPKKAAVVVGNQSPPVSSAKTAQSHSSPSAKTAQSPGAS